MSVQAFLGNSTDSLRYITTVDYKAELSRYIGHDMCWAYGEVVASVISSLCEVDKDLSCIKIWMARR